MLWGQKWGVTSFFINYFIRISSLEAHSSEYKYLLKTCISNSMPCHFLREDFPHVVMPLSSLFLDMNNCEG